MWKSLQGLQKQKIKFVRINNKFYGKEISKSVMDKCNIHMIRLGTKADGKEKYEKFMEMRRRGPS